MNDVTTFDRPCGHPGWGGACDVCWAKVIHHRVTVEGRLAIQRRDRILRSLVANGLDPDVASLLGDRWESDYFDYFKNGIGDSATRALNDAFEVAP